MPEHVILLSIPGLRPQDLVHMDHLRRLTESGERASLVPSFPCVTCPVQANMTTGRLPSEHGVVANGFYWRQKRDVEMWTAWKPVPPIVSRRIVKFEILSRLIPTSPPTRVRSSTSAASPESAVTGEPLRRRQACSAGYAASFATPW